MIEIGSHSLCSINTHIISVKQSELDETFSKALIAMPLFAGLQLFCIYIANDSITVASFPETTRCSET